MKKRVLDFLINRVVQFRPGKIQNKVRSQPRLVEIVRSFSYKLNVGNYESRDFFCSQKVECLAADADEVSAAVYQWCKKQVLGSVKEFIAEHPSSNQRRAS